MINGNFYCKYITHFGSKPELAGTVTVKHYQNSGFTLIELLTVIVLLGILSIVALGRFSGPDQFAARGFFDDTVVAVRFAQKLAISSGCDVQMIASASDYRLMQRASCLTGAFSQNVPNPANRSINYANSNMPAGFSLTVGTITFDARGVRLEPSSVFTLSGTPSYSFRVHASTGFVEVI